MAFSRVKTLAGLHILHFNSKAIKKSTEVENEMVRLNSNLLPPGPKASCDPCHVTIALLNVRSIVAKLPDIRTDDNFKSANILCFCETWLNASQPSPVLLDDQIDIRCDRVTCENKGGVLICLTSQMDPSDVQRFTSNGIEAVSATLQILNAGSLQIAMVYRSPSVPQQVFTPVLSRLLRHVSICTTPCVILGDFNCDILNNLNSSVTSFMYSFGFRQLVTVPTTAQGTLIDHVYYRGIPDSAVVHISDTYYSDHDTVYCRITLM